MATLGRVTLWPQCRPSSLHMCSVAGISSLQGVRPSGSDCGLVFISLAFPPAAVPPELRPRGQPERLAHASQHC